MDSLPGALIGIPKLNQCCVSNGRGEINKDTSMTASEVIFNRINPSLPQVINITHGCIDTHRHEHSSTQGDRLNRVHRSADLLVYWNKANIFSVPKSGSNQDYAICIYKDSLWATYNLGDMQV